MKATTNVDTAVNSPGNEKGFVVATSATVAALDVTVLSGGYISLQAIGFGCDVYFVDQVATPTVDPVITAAGVRTLGVGRAVYVGVDKDMVVPIGRSGKMWLVYKAAGVGTLRGLEA